MIDKSKRFVSFGLLLLGVVAMVLVPAASALPQYAAQTGLACGKCHVSPAGGGTRTAFGAAFAANGHKLPAAAPATPPVVVTKPVTPPVVVTKPVTPPVVVTKPVTPPVVTPPIIVTKPVTPPIIVTKPVTPPVIVTKPAKDSDKLNDNDEHSNVGKSVELKEAGESTDKTTKDSDKTTKDSDKTIKDSDKTTKDSDKTTKVGTEKVTKGNRRKH